jgi:mRNA interferase HigB
MHVISEKTLREFWAIHPDAEKPLRAWCQVANRAQWKTFAEVRESFPHADLVDDLTVFNIGGNKYRLIVAVHLNRGKVFVRHILTHAQYDLGQWKGKRSPPKRQPKKKAPKRKDKPG